MVGGGCGWLCGCGVCGGGVMWWGCGVYVLFWCGCCSGGRFWMLGVGYWWFFGVV